MKKNAFTLVETMVAMSLFFIALSFFYINLTRLPSSTNQNLAVTKLISDIKLQQTQSTNGTKSSIVFSDTSYTLLPQNTVINLEGGIKITSNGFPGGVVEFEKGGGEIKNYIFGLDEIVLTNDVTGENKVIKINKYAATY